MDEDQQRPDGSPPAAISHLARERTEARRRRDWAQADALKAEIEAAGWRLVDRGLRSSLRPAAPPDVEVEGVRRYGSAASVPSRLGDPPAAAWTLVAVASEDPARLSALLAALRDANPARGQVVLVANDPSQAQAAALAPGSPDLEPVGGGPPEVVRTSARLGYAAALNMGLRRAAGEVVLLADGSAVPAGDAVGPLVEALADPAVAVAGAYGLVSTDPARLRPAGLEPSDARRVVALLGAWLAFRRADYTGLGPLDEGFATPAWLDVWWSLRLRAGEGPAEVTETAETAETAAAARGGNVGQASDRGDGGDTAYGGDAETAAPRAGSLPQGPPGAAIRLDLPLVATPGPAWPPDRGRLSRRNAYRLLDWFASRTDLLESPAAVTADPA